MYLTGRRFQIPPCFACDVSALPTEIGVLLVKVNDFPKMMSFYRDKLGLPVSTINPGGDDIPMVNWVRFETNGTAIELFVERQSEAGRLPLPRNNAIAVAFKVSDIELVFDELKRRGVEFPKGIGVAEWGRYVHFADPEGNRLQLYEPRPGY